MVAGRGLRGCFPCLAPALQARGYGAAVAGMIVAGYGLTVLVGTRIVKQIALRVPAAILLAGGGLMLVAGFAAAAINPAIPGVLTASILAGGAYAFMHSTLQSWVTDVAPSARGTTAALFVTAYQCSRGVAVTFGLEYLVVNNSAELADGAIYRANEICLGQGSRIRAQSAGEKFVEAGVAMNVSIGGLGHVDPVTRNKPADQAGGISASLGIGDFSGEEGEGLLG